MVQEHVSAGIIPLHRRNGSDKYLLLKYPQGHWGFPKGHIENDETLWETAVRELEEETGLGDVERIGDYKQSLEYWYELEGQKHHKIVTFFGGLVETRSVHLSVEHHDYTWLSHDETLKKITYDNERELFKSWLEFYGTA